MSDQSYICESHFGWLAWGAKTKEHALYLKKMRLRTLAIVLTQICLLALLFLIWEYAAQRQWIDSFVTSQPTKVWGTIYQMSYDGSLYRHIWTTAYETILGFVIGTVAGTALAILLWWSDFLAKVLEPYIVVLNSTPKVALGPLFIVLVGNNLTSIVLMALAISIVTTIIMVYTGFKEVDPNKIRLMQTFGANKLQILQKVTLPASLPTILAALKVSVGLSMVGVVVGEFLSAKAGLGYLIIYGGQVFNMTLVMTSVIILAIVAAILYQAVAMLEKRFLNWRR
jgi:NitT/TauT family transport system permease protein